MAKKNEGLIQEIVNGAAARIKDNLKVIEKLSLVPVGKEVMTPAQVKQKFGLGVRQIEDLIKEHGEETIAQLLPLLRGGGNG